MIMTQEDIKSYARGRAQDQYCRSENSMRQYTIAQIHAFTDGFLDRAEWRINSVWHSTSEEPEVDRHCIIEVESIEDEERFINYVSSVWSTYGWTEDYLQLIDRRSEGHQYKITRWAYVEDLLPNKEE